MPKRGRKTGDKFFPGSRSSPSERVVWLLETVWEGNRSEMGRAVGCSHAVLSKIASGHQGVGRQLLTAIASHPKVSPAWLFGGEGEPLLAEREDAPSEGWPLPVAKQLLPGEPNDNRHLLSGESYPIAGAFYRPTRYWLEIQRGDPIVKEQSQRVHSGDLLLMETAQAWRNEHRLVDERLCAIYFVSEGSESQVRLGLVTFEPDTEDDAGYFVVDAFERSVDQSQLVREIVLREYPGARFEARLRLMHKVSKEGEPEQFAHVSNVCLGPNRKSLRLRDICAVCLMVVRRL